MLTLNEMEKKVVDALSGTMTIPIAIRAVAWAIFYLAHVLRYKR